MEIRQALARLIGEYVIQACEAQAKVADLRAELERVKAAQDGRGTN